MGREIDLGGAGVKIRWAPFKALSAAVLLGVAGILICVLVVLRGPYLGIAFAPTPEGVGVVVASVSPAHPNAERLAAGTVVEAVRTAAGAEVSLTGQTLLPEPDILPYRALGSFFAQQQRLSNALQARELKALAADGQEVVLIKARRGLADIPALFWAHAVYALLALIICCGIWAFRPDQAGPRWLALSAVGYYLMNMAPAVYSSRELALDAGLFSSLSTLNHLGTALHITSLAGMMWFYPVRLKKRVTLNAMLLLVGGLLVLDWLRIGYSAAYTHYLPMALVFLAGVAAAVRQWALTRHRPAERAALLWILLAVFWATATSTSLLIVPVIFGNDQLLPQHLGFAPLLLMYLGLAAGVSRYRLFELESWWHRSWIWAAVGFLVIVTDLFLVLLVGLDHSRGLLLSVLLAGLIYIPLRQWMLARFLARDDPGMTRTLSRLTGGLIGLRTTQQLHDRLLATLSDMFRPLDIRIDAKPTPRIIVEADAQALRLPHPFRGESIVLVNVAGGMRLVSQRDVDGAGIVLDVFRHAADALQAQVLAAAEERERVIGDLHDDLGAKLLTIVHTTGNGDGRELARSALSDLRAIVGQQREPPRRLVTVVDDIRKEFNHRARLAGLTGQLESVGTLRPVSLSGRMANSLASIAREFVTNALKHARATELTLGVASDDEKLKLSLQDNGQGSPVAGWVEGGGSRSIRRRADEMAAELDFASDARSGTRAVLTLFYDRLPPVDTLRPDASADPDGSLRKSPPRGTKS